MIGIGHDAVRDCQYDRPDCLPTSLRLCRSVACPVPNDGRVAACQYDGGCGVAGATTVRLPLMLSSVRVGSRGGLGCDGDSRKCADDKVDEVSGLGGVSSLASVRRNPVEYQHIGKYFTLLLIKSTIFVCIYCCLFVSLQHDEKRKMAELKNFF